MRKAPHFSQFQVSQHPTKEELHALLSAVPLKKKTLIYLLDQLHQAQLPHEDIGISLALVALNALWQEKAGKPIADAGAEFVKEEFRMTAIESLVPFVEELFLTLPRWFTLVFSLLGASLSMLVSSVHGFWLIVLALIGALGWLIWCGWHLVARWQTKKTHAGAPETLLAPLPPDEQAQAPSSPPGSHA